MERLLGYIEKVAAVLLLAMALLTVTAAFFRYSGLKQIPDWFLLISYLQGIALFWGIAITTYRQNHITVDLVWIKLSAVGRRRLDLFAHFVSAAFLGVFAWAQFEKVLATAQSGLQTNELRLLVWPFFAIACAGVLCAFVLSVVMVIRSFMAPMLLDQENI